MLKISNVSKTFNTGTINEKKALRNISLHLEGEILLPLSVATVPENQRC